MEGQTVCQFGGTTLVMADVASSGEVRCAAPAWAVGTVPVRGATNFNGQMLQVSDFSADVVKYTYGRNVVPGVSAPETALVMGGSQVVVQVPAAKITDRATCRTYGTVATNAVSEQGVVTCSLPA